MTDYARSLDDLSRSSGVPTPALTLVLRDFATRGVATETESGWRLTPRGEELGRALHAARPDTMPRPARGAARRVERGS